MSIKATYAIAVVVLHNGARVSWKINRGGSLDAIGRGLSERYFMGIPHSECEVRSARFEEPAAFEWAERWCASFLPHERESGGRPDQTAGRGEGKPL